MPCVQERSILIVIVRESFLSVQLSRPPVPLLRHEPIEEYNNYINYLGTLRGLIHNHPSGDTTPSRADIEMTRDIARALTPVGVTVHDHVIVGGGEPASLRAMGLL